MHYKKLFIAAAAAASFTMPGSLVMGHAYQGEYYEDRYDSYARDRGMPHPADRPNNDGAAMVVLLVGGFIIYRVFRRSRGARYSPGLFHNGGGYNDALGRYHRTEEPSAEPVPHYDDPSIGYFWGNPVDGTNVKSLWGTTKDE